MDIEKLDCWYSLLLAVPAVASLIALAQCLGSLLLRWTQLKSPTSSYSHFPFTGILGLNLLGLLAWVAAWLPTSARLPIALVACAIAWFWIARSATAIIAQSRHVLAACSWRHALFALPILFTLGPALAYPSGWDELAYHLELPHRWHEAQSLSVQLDLPYSALPSLLEAIFTLTYPIEPLIAPRLLVWVIWLQGLLVFRHACGQLCRSSNANCLTLAMAACPAGLLISANCYVESLIWANVACLLDVLVLKGEKTNVYAQAILLSIFIGGAIAIKITSIGLLCIPIFVWLLQSDRSKLSWQPSVLTMHLAICFAAPFYLRTWLLVGNPVAPFYAKWFTSDAAWLECSRYHHDLAVSNFGMRGLPGFLVGPGALAFAYELYDGSFGWQWLIMLLLLVVAVLRASKMDRPRQSFVKLCITAAVLFYALWFLTSQQVRFAIPLAMIVILAAGVGIETYREPIQRWWRVALICLSLVSIPWINFGYYLDSWLCVLKVRTPLDYIRDGVTDSYAELSLYLHEQVPTDAKIVSLFEHRLVYFPGHVEIATPYFQVKYFRSPGAETPESLISELRESGVTHVVLTTNPLGPDISSSRIADQQQWFRNIDQCIAGGQLEVLWKSEFHAVAKVVSPAR